MLTHKERINQAIELQENYQRLNQDLSITLKALQMSERKLQCVLKMKNENPGNCFMVRDYLEDKLRKRYIIIFFY